MQSDTGAEHRPADPPGEFATCRARHRRRETCVILCRRGVCFVLSLTHATIQDLVGRLARLNALGRYVERQMGAQTTPTETAWIQESEQSLRRQAGKELDEDFVPGATPPRARARQFA